MGPPQSVRSSHRSENPARAVLLPRGGALAWHNSRDVSDAGNGNAPRPCAVPASAVFSTVGTLNWRLYRLVIEIRDAVLNLRAYVTPAIIAAAQQFAAARQTPGAQLDAAAAACWLETARRAKLAGTPPQPRVCDITTPGGESLREEIEFLLTVARFHAGTLPTEFAAHYLRRSRGIHPRHHRAPFPGRP